MKTSFWKKAIAVFTAFALMITISGTDVKLSNAAGLTGLSAGAENSNYTGGSGGGGTASYISVAMLTWDLSKPFSYLTEDILDALEYNNAVNLIIHFAAPGYTYTNIKINGKSLDENTSTIDVTYKNSSSVSVINNGNGGNAYINAPATLSLIITADVTDNAGELNSIDDWQNRIDEVGSGLYIEAEPKEEIGSYSVSSQSVSPVVYVDDNGGSGGNGIPENAIHIQTANQLAAIGGAQSAGKYYVLDNDINLVDEWVPIDDFRGTFDGQGHSINNLKIGSYSAGDGTNRLGLFSTISDVVIKNVEINIAGIEFINNNDTSDYVGGLCGMSWNSTIENCHVNGDIIVTTANKQEKNYGITVGGLVGAIYGSTVKNCAVSSNVTGHGFSGGLVGMVNGSPIVSIISNCYTTGNISALDSNWSAAGGLVGCRSNTHELVIKNSYAVGDIYAVGESNYIYTGGLLGCNNYYDFIVSNSYRLSTQSIVGGYTNSYGTPLPSDEMRQKSSYVDWDFDNIWTIDPNQNNGFPILREISYEPDSDSDFEYTISDNKVTITKYIGKGGAVEIPDSIEGKPVTIIGNDAFREKTSVTSVVIPNTVTTINYGAFRNCTSLVSVTLPNSVKTIGNSAFEGCTSLKTVVIPDSVTSMGTSVFYECTGLTSVTLGSGLGSIGNDTFSDCVSLAEITLPENIKSLGDYVFTGCEKLVYVLIPKSVTSIGEEVFENSPNTTIYCYKDSEAHKYAVSNSIEYVLLDGETPNSKKNVKFGFDTFDFINDYDAFYSDNDKNGLYDYNIKPQYLHALLNTANNNAEKEDIKWLKTSDWGGSCFGMSAVLSLVKAGRITPDFFQSKAKITHDFDKPVSNFTVESLINYYMLMQMNDSTWYKIREYFYDAPEIQNKKVLDEIIASKYPVMLCFWFWAGGHAVVAYDVTKDTYGNYKVKIADPNDNTQPVILTISADYKEAYFSDDWYNWDLILGSASKIEDLDYDFQNLESYLKGESTPAVNSLRASSVSAYTKIETNYQNFTIVLKNSSSTVSAATIVDGKKTSGNLDISGYMENEAGYELRMGWNVPNLSAGQYFEITPSATETSIVTEKSIDEYRTSTKCTNNLNGYFTSVTADKAGVIKIEYDGEVKTNYATPTKQTVSATVNDAETPWYTVTYEGTSTGLDVTPSSDETSVTSVDSAKLNITASDDFNTIGFKDVKTSSNEITLLEENRVGILTDGTKEIDSKTFGYSVMFFTFDSDDVNMLKDVAPNSKISEPTPPQHPEFTFEGWYKDINHTEKWDFNKDVVTDNISLYANFVNSSGTILGDVNSDGKVNTKDVTRFKRNLAGWANEPINSAAADVNGDGKIGEKDVSYIKKAIAGWKDYKDLIPPTSN